MTNLWNAIRAELTPSRVVPVTGHLLATGVGLLTTWLATKGWLNLDPAEVLAIVTPIVTGIEGSVLHWQKGNRETEERRARNREAIQDYDVHPDDLKPDGDDLDSARAKAAEERALAEEERKARRARPRRG